MAYALALGNFDGLHLGHKRIITKMLGYAKENDLDVALFTFENDLDLFLGKKGGLVHIFSERKKILENLGVQKILSYNADKNFLSMEGKEFLDKINDKIEIKAYFCGKDYAFGKGASCKTDCLTEYAKAKNQKVFVVDDYELFGEKVSTTRIKKHLENGEIERANKLLGESYFIDGKVVTERQVGRTLGYPTANLKLDIEKFKLKDGVYGGYTFIDGKKYNVAINYGGRPTFEMDGMFLEAYVIDYSGDLYGKCLTLYFEKYIRSIERFNSAEELKKQIERDIEKCKK